MHNNYEDNRRGCTKKTMVLGEYIGEDSQMRTHVNELGEVIIGE